ncbi:MAG: glycosyltransferase family 4 protein [Methanomassiliicoccales archaeon]|nr:MAG: glycosyltransferase family 4 protein [Methanomassiliicoccales archaeon]
MKIAVLTDTYLPTIDGVVNSLITTRKALENLGHEVFIIAPEDRKNGNPEDPNTIYLRARELKMYPGYRLATLLPGKEVRFFREHNFDVIHTHGLAVMSAKGIWVAHTLKLPLVLTFHTMVLDALNWYNPTGLRLGFVEFITKWWVRYVLHRCYGVIAPTSAILEELKDLAPKMRMTDIIPTGIDQKRFNPGIDGSRVREKWGLDGEEVILHVGRISPEKNLDMLFDAFASLRKRRDSVKLMVVGMGPAAQDCKSCVKEKGISDDVIFTGFVSDEELPEYYAACDTFAITSTFETQGLVVLEAMASGKPVAGIRYRAIPEFVKEDVTGYLFDPDDTEGCADAIEKALDHHDGIVQNARTMAEGYSIKTCTKKLIDMYERVIAFRKSIG